jgi:hypothetical protein
VEGAADFGDCHAGLRAAALAFSSETGPSRERARPADAIRTEIVEDSTERNFRFCI